MNDENAEGLIEVLATTRADWEGVPRTLTEMVNQLEGIHNALSALLQIMADRG